MAPGELSEIKTIYQRPDEEENVSWVDECPKEITTGPDRNAKSTQFAIILRQKQSKSPLRALEAHSIVIQSQALRDALSEYVFKDYPGPVWEVDRVVFEAPFRPFVNRWAKFQKLKKRRNLDGKTKEHIALLYDLLSSELSDAISMHQGYTISRVVPWHNLWMILISGEVVITNNNGSFVASKVLQAGYGKDKDGEFFSIHYFSVDWSGDFFGYYEQEQKIRPYEDQRGINTLPIYPIDFHEDKNLRNLLTLRGKKFESSVGYHYKSYNGAAITWNRSSCNEEKVHVSGRIIIDRHEFARYSPFSFRHVRRRLSPEKDNIPKTLTSDHHMLCMDRLYGYSPQLHTWMDFFVDNIQDIEWRTNTLEGLVLPKPKKDLLAAITRAKKSGEHEFSDFIEGKGEGIIMLLSGPPGTGKTLTAEAIAEDMRVPLIAITFSNLGHHVYMIERELSRIFELAAHWNSILLLDECDVFLQARSPDRLEQNNIVSIFLRTLEYYKGILFMTSNHTANIDPAFSSRIHLSLEYPELDQDSRLQVWNTVLKSLVKSHELSHEDILRLSNLDINGRQIKNIARMAQLLALSNKQSLRIESIDTILSIESRQIASMPTRGSSGSFETPLSVEGPTRNPTNKETDTRESTESRTKRKATRTDDVQPSSHRRRRL
ncbi:P-loop containing nucleoside triphosphate hydrolase protein [Talaromyces proteolyticus]|uniref:P-loop containing nucleoside triphosphate hydrolase protein n=1 Tax=Talaromyces proteolyticus TaxID=1131652 RepID=A0AAD4L3R4_9EURO|nr:P-loop containing nucleoside triphosphate hydrolase protein [Talaromyces proteolyticus]KAH8703663.1 P-loop containing nucleoside triphosphate hydrolase protein [Talaromyces proteolyticus]